MKFEHCNHLGDLELKKKETKGIRLYNLPNGEWVPSKIGRASCRERV